MKRNPTPENRSVRTRVARAESRSHPQIEVKPESFGLTKFLGANAIRKTKREIWRTASALKGQNPNGLAHVSSSSNTLLAQRNRGKRREPVTRTICAITQGQGYCPSSRDTPDKISNS